MDNSIEQTVKLLHEKYGKMTLNKKEAAQEMGIGLSTLSARMTKGMDHPEFLKTGEHKQASIVFPIRAVAEYLHRTVKVV